MPVIDTRALFEVPSDRIEQASTLVGGLFPDRALVAIAYELRQQGLLEQGEAWVTFDYWETVRQLLTRLQELWRGPDVAVYLLPIQHGAIKNGVSYKKGICLFIAPLITTRALQALFAHEYCHSCHRHTLREPPTLVDSLVTEGLAEYAVESLYGGEALNEWTTRYSLDEVQDYWQQLKQKLDVVGLHQHRVYLLGGGAYPAWIGYCTGYRIVQTFLEKNGAHTVQQLLRIPTKDILVGAGFEV